MQSLLQKKLFWQPHIFQDLSSQPKFIGKQMQKYRSTWGNTHQPTDFFRQSGFGLIPKMSPWHSWSKRAAKSKLTPHFPPGVPKLRGKEKSMDEWFPVQIILRGQLCRNSKFLGPQTDWSLPKVLPRDSGAQSSSQIYGSTRSSALGCGCKCVSRIHHMSCTKTNSNLCKNPLSSANHNGSYHKSHFLRQKLTAF